MKTRVVLLIVLAVTLCHASAVRAQLTLDESKQLQRLTMEPPTAASISQRLSLIGQALNRETDPKLRLSSSFVPSMLRAGIPAADALPFLIGRLDQPTEIGKRTAMALLAEYGRDARPAVPKLRQLMDDENRNISADAMMTLAKIDPDNREIAEAMVARLGATDDNHTNRSILQALIRMASVVPKAEAPKIARFRDHKWSEVGLFAFEAGGKVLALPRPSLEKIEAMTTLEWRGMSDHGYAVLATIQEAGPKATFAVPLLVELLTSDPPVYLKCAALDALGKVSVGHPRVISALLDGLVSPDLFYRHKARVALQGADLKRPDAVRAMSKGLRHADASVRFEAATQLWVVNARPGAATAPLAEALPDLVATLTEVNEDVSPGQLHAYLQILRAIGPAAAPAAEPLLKIYASDTYFQKHKTSFRKLERGLLLAVLADINVPHSAKPVLIEALKKDPKDDFEPGYTYASAARALARLGPDAPEAISLLLPALKPQEPELVFSFIDWSPASHGSPFTTARLEAVRTLGAIGPAAREALPTLREFADGKHPAPKELGTRLLQESRRAVELIERKAVPKNN